MRRFVVMTLALGLLTACGRPHQADLLEDGAYQTLQTFDEPFTPIESVEAISLVWLWASPHDGTGAGWREQARNACDHTADSGRCSTLLLQAIANTAKLPDYERGVEPFPARVCVMCEPEGGYLFVVSNGSAQLTPRAGVIELFGSIDAPGEAMVTLGREAKLRPNGEAFELITKDLPCDPSGPKWTVWNVDRAGSATEVAQWLERSGNNCDDV